MRTLSMLTLAVLFARIQPSAHAQRSAGFRGAGASQPREDSVPGDRGRGRTEVGPKLAFTFEGSLHLPDGTLADGAVVVSSAGGSAVTDDCGQYQLEISLPFEAESLHVTAVAATGRSLMASTVVPILAGSGSIPVPPPQ